MKLIPLSQGKFARVDDSDFNQLSKFRWTLKTSKRTKVLYAKRFVIVEGKHTTIQMHAEIMKPAKGLQVDHRDRDGLNNQRSNLRVTTRAQNQRNQRKHSKGSSRYRGVCKGYKGWLARISVDNKQISLGTFKTELEAALAYDFASLKYHGEHGRTNFEAVTNRKSGSQPVEKKD